MGEGKTFALVQGKNIYIFDAIRERSRGSDPSASSARVSSISVPEDAELQRNLLQSLIAAALESYGKHHGFLWVGFSPSVNNQSVSFEGTRWIVRPRKHSCLYWKKKAEAWINKHKRRALNLKSYLASPFLALMAFSVSLALSVSKADGANLAVVLSGMWFARRLMRYDNDYVLKYWFVGVLKLKHPCLAFKAIERLVTPRPLPALIVKIEFSSLDCSTCMVSVKNTTLFPIRYLFISSRVLANLLAPGFIKSLPPENKGKKFLKELEAVYPSLTKNWILPRCSVNWRVPVLVGYPLRELKRDIEAIVYISRYVSGEPTSKATSYLLPVVVTGPYARDIGGG